MSVFFAWFKNVLVSIYDDGGTPPPDWPPK